MNVLARLLVRINDGAARCRLPAVSFLGMRELALPVSKPDMLRRICSEVLLKSASDGRSARLLLLRPNAALLLARPSPSSSA